jgi:hypothetical protein
MDQRNKQGRNGKVQQSFMQPKMQTQTMGSQQITKIFGVLQSKKSKKETK